MQDQDSIRLDVRRDRPGWIYLQGWGAMNPTAVEEAAKNNFKMDHLVGVWWSGGDQDARPAGTGGKGYSTLDINGVGQNYPAIQDILKYVVDKGKSQTPKDQVGENLYNRAVMNAALIAEGIRNAQTLTSKKLDRRCRHAPGLGVAERQRNALERVGSPRLCRTHRFELQRPQRAR